MTMLKWKLLRALLVVPASFAASVWAADATVTVNCTLGNNDGTTQELTCNLGAIRFNLPASLGTPISGGGNLITLPGSAGPYNCTLNTNRNSVPGGSTQGIELGLVCTGQQPNYYAWSAPGVTFTHPNNSTTGAVMNLSNTTTPSVLISVSACDDGPGSNCQTFTTTVTNSTYTGATLTAPTGCSITGVTNGQTVAQGAALTLGVSCSNLQSPTYSWGFNNASQSAAASFTHTPFPASTTHTTGTYNVQVCNNQTGLTPACTMVPTTGGVVVNRAATAPANVLAACPAGTVIDTVLGPGQATDAYGLNYYTSTGSVPRVVQFTVPQSAVGTSNRMSIVWNSSIGVSTPKRVILSKGVACSTAAADEGKLLGNNHDAGSRQFTYSTTPGTSRLTPGVWYLAISSPGCTSNCNAKVQVYP